MSSLKAGGFLTQVNYGEKCTFWALKGWFLKTGGLKTQVVLRTCSTVRKTRCISRYKFGLLSHQI